MIRRIFSPARRPASPGRLLRRRTGSRHGGTAPALLDEPKYPAGFKHFDYVNPNAPKGGLVRLGAQGTFDSFNIVVAGVKGTPEQGIGLDLRDPDHPLARRAERMPTASSPKPFPSRPISPR